MPDADSHWDGIVELLEGDGLGMLMLGRSWIGDEHEIERIGTNLSISREHLVEPRRNGSVVDATVYLPPEHVPDVYRGRASSTGAVPMRIRFDLSEVIHLDVMSGDAAWRSQRVA
jgi:hypothetical protein